MKKDKLPFDEGLGESNLGDYEFVRLSMNFGRRVREIMKEHNIKQSDLANDLGKKESEISRWLSGLHNLTLRNMAKINAALPVPAVTISSSSVSEDVGLVTNSEMKVVFINDVLRPIRNSSEISAGDYSDNIESDEPGLISHIA